MSCRALGVSERTYVMDYSRTGVRMLSVHVRMNGFVSKSMPCARFGQGRLGDTRFPLPPSAESPQHQIRRHQTPHFRENATSAAAELGGEIHHVARSRARRGRRSRAFVEVARLMPSVGWHDFSNATCLMRPHLFCTALCV